MQGIFPCFFVLPLAFFFDLMYSFSKESGGGLGLAPYNKRRQRHEKEKYWRKNLTLSGSGSSS